MNLHFPHLPPSTGAFFSQLSPAKSNSSLFFGCVFSQPCTDNVILLFEDTIVGVEFALLARTILSKSRSEGLESSGSANRRIAVEFSFSKVSFESSQTHTAVVSSVSRTYIVSYLFSCTSNASANGSAPGSVAPSCVKRTCYVSQRTYTRFTIARAFTLCRCIVRKANPLAPIV